MPTKLGAHVLRMGDKTLVFIQAGPAVVKFAGDWAAAKDVPAGTLVTGRLVAPDDAQSQRARGLKPAQAAYEFVYKWKQIDAYNQNPDIFFWEGHNEPVWSDREGVAWYAQMEIERMKLMDAAGFKCVIGNFAAGSPTLELWPAFVPACRYALEHNHFLGLHEYSTPFMWWMTGKYQLDPGENCRTSDNKLAGWVTLRYRQIYDQFLKPAGLGNLPLVITECGLDPLIGPVPDNWPRGTYQYLGGWWSKGPSVWGKPLPTDFAPAAGWNYADRDQFYVQQLAWYDHHLLQDPYVLGMTIFTFGNYGPPWKDFDVTLTGAADLLTAYIKAQR
jgi:hypothetical protein